MRIAVLADTHDRWSPGLPAALRGADEVWHLGDVTRPLLLEELRSLGAPVRWVRGNCDATELGPLSEDLAIEGFRIRLIHIPPRLAPAGCDLLLHGHTHVPRDEMLGGVRFLNPGCITRPNRGAPASYAWLELRQGQRPQWELVLTRR